MAKRAASKQRPATSPSPILGATYWGATGSTPASHRPHAGGDTTCIEVRTPGALLILDGGTGLRALGKMLEAKWGLPPGQYERRAHLLLSHSHLDHILGIPFFAPFFDDRNHFTLYAAGDVFDKLAVMMETFYPSLHTKQVAIRKRQRLTAGQHFQIGATRIRTHALNHPVPCLAFRIDHADRSFVFATDHEPTEMPDRELAEFARHADVLYMDGQFLQEEYEGAQPLPGEQAQSRRGWGHGTITGCIETAVAAGVRFLSIGHHDPSRSDAHLKQMEREGRRRLEEALRRAGRAPHECRMEMAREGACKAI